MFSELLAVEVEPRTQSTFERKAGTLNPKQVVRLIQRLD